MAEQGATPLSDEQVAAQLMERWSNMPDPDVDEPDLPEIPEPERPGYEPKDAADSGDEATEDKAEEKADSDELTADDLPDDSPDESDPGAIEITWNGRKQRVSREEAVRLAQQGYDYTQKTQALAEERQRVQQYAQALQQTAQLQAAVVDDLAAVKALQRQMAAYPQDPSQWQALSNEDPIAAFQRRTEFDALRQQAEQMMRGIQAKAAQVQQGRAQISQEQLAQQFAKAVDAVPEWRDIERYRSDVNNMRGFAQEVGYTDEELNNIDDHRPLIVLKYAAAYAQLLKAKKEKLKQVRTAPPVTRPGNSKSAAATDTVQQQKLEERFKRSGDLKDAAAVLLARNRKEMRHGR